MKLCVVIVLMASEEYEKLFDLHLSQIKGTLRPLKPIRAVSTDPAHVSTEVETVSLTKIMNCECSIADLHKYEKH